MKHEDARADLDDFAAEMMESSQPWTHTRRLDTLRSLEILSKKALRAIAGHPNEAEQRNDIAALQDGIKRMLAATERREAVE
ncbi:MAG: hypothetical protein ACN6O2_07335 [Stenotrophomonas sp.]